MVKNKKSSLYKRGTTLRGWESFGFSRPAHKWHNSSNDSTRYSATNDVPDNSQIWITLKSLRRYDYDVVTLFRRPAKLYKLL